MSFKKTFFLALILFCIGGYFKYFQLPKEERAERTKLILKDVSPKNAKEIFIKNSHGSFTLTTKQNKTDKSEPTNTDSNNWSIKELPDAKVDQVSLNLLLDALTDLKFANPLKLDEQSEDLGVYGFKEPLVKIEIKTNELESEIELGKLNDYLYQRYIRRSGDPNIYLVNDTIFTASNKTLDDFRDKMLFLFYESDLREIETSGAKISPFKLKSTNGDDWQIKSPREYLADDDRVKLLIKTIKNLKAEKFFEKNDENLKKYGFTNQPLKIKLILKQQENRAIEALLSKVEIEENNNKKTRTFITVSDNISIAQLSGNPIEDLSPIINDLRAKKFLKFDENEIKSIKIERKEGESLMIEKQEGIWSVNQKEADAPFIEQLIRDFRDLTAKNLANDSDLEKSEEDFFKKSFGTITLTIVNKDEQKEAKQIILKVGKSNEKSDNYLAQLNDNKLTRHFLEQSQIKKIFPTFEQLSKSSAINSGEK
ncbi:MAG TPA: DUF4340 domain-containing protein [Oligoflexia bacterium]|nr:DUF4340 domain-containing protein [Oligoflexia bacterium]HMP27425.1 DUF4340 domain-containing protein [Oligoflexia bacterium]